MQPQPEPAIAHTTHGQFMVLDFQIFIFGRGPVLITIRIRIMMASNASAVHHFAPTLFKPLRRELCLCLLIFVLPPLDLGAYPARV